MYKVTDVKRPRTYLRCDFCQVPATKWITPMRYFLSDLTDEQLMPTHPKPGTKCGYHSGVSLTACDLHLQQAIQELTGKE